jgi:hypothetical protein
MKIQSSGFRFLALERQLDVHEEHISIFRSKNKQARNPPEARGKLSEA